MSLTFINLKYQLKIKSRSISQKWIFQKETWRHNYNNKVRAGLRNLGALIMLMQQNRIIYNRRENTFLYSFSALLLQKLFNKPKRKSHICMSKVFLYLIRWWPNSLLRSAPIQSTWNRLVRNWTLTVIEGEYIRLKYNIFYIFLRKK